MVRAIRLNINSFCVRPATLAVTGVELEQKLSSFCTSLNILPQRGVSTHTAAIYSSIFVKFLHPKCGGKELDSPESEVAKFCISWKL